MNVPVTDNLILARWHVALMLRARCPSVRLSVCNAGGFVTDHIVQQKVEMSTRHTIGQFLGYAKADPD